MDWAVRNNDVGFVPSAVDEAHYANYKNKMDKFSFCYTERYI